MSLPDHWQSKLARVLLVGIVCLAANKGAWPVVVLAIAAGLLLIHAEVSNS